MRRFREEPELEQVAYFNGPAPADPVLDHPRVVRRSIGDAPVRGLTWQERRLPAAAASDRLDVFFSPAYACPLRLRVPRVTTVHDLSFFSWPEDTGTFEGLRRRLLVAASVRASARLLVDCDFGRRELVARFPDAAPRVTVVPLGSDDDLVPGPPRDEARRALGVAGPRILSVGSIFNRRRLPVLLEALAQVRRTGLDATLDVVGDNRTSPLVDFPLLARTLGVEDAVSFHGFLPEDDLARRYAAADVFVFLSEYEGFGLPVLEAMRRGLPVVTSTRPSLGELFAGAAMLVNPTDADALAAGLGYLLRSPRQREDLAERGRERASRFSWRACAEQTLAVLGAAAR
jgi:glycosyltransferase involved in cell wall biosynthesis